MSELQPCRLCGKRAICHDCGTPYGGPDWVDTVLPDEQWKLIFPEQDGLLCANCIIKRASRLDGIICTEMRLIFVDAHEPPESHDGEKGCAGDPIGPIPPLTLEQLRQMDGEPVWCVEKQEWMLYRASVDRLSDGEYMFVPDNLTVYAHKPGGEQE